MVKVAVCISKLSIKEITIFLEIYFTMLSRSLDYIALIW
jgi:hypothetical protein